MTARLVTFRKNPNWDYSSNSVMSTGYEDIMDKIDIISPKEFLSLNEEGRKLVVDKIFTEIRSRNYFPINYYNDLGIQREILKCRDKKVSDLSNGVLDENSNLGSSLCKFMFPNMHKVVAKGRENNTMWCKFYDDHKLKRAIDFRLRHERISNVPSKIYRSLQIIDSNSPTNFSPMKAKAIYEKYCPINGVIYDFSCGFGGRMLGALSSNNNYTYIGCEPCKETYYYLNNLGRHIEKTFGTSNTFKIHNVGSEEVKLKSNSIDFAFSSPPYFSLEKYSDEESQCYIKYPTLDLWFDNYVLPTIKTIYDSLKRGCYYAVNISDFKVGNKEVHLVNKWVEFSELVGFELTEVMTMKLNIVVGRDGFNSDTTKQEGVYVFRKPL